MPCHAHPPPHGHPQKEVGIHGDAYIEPGSQTSRNTHTPLVEAAHPDGSLATELQRKSDSLKEQKLEHVSKRTFMQLLSNYINQPLSSKNKCSRVESLIILAESSHSLPKNQYSWFAVEPQKVQIFTVKILLRTKT